VGCLIFLLDSTRLSVWLVDGDIYHRGLLKFALTEQSFPQCCVLLVASLARPWDIMDTLARWSDVLSTHINRLKLPTAVRKQQEESSECSPISNYKIMCHCAMWLVELILFSSLLASSMDYSGCKINERKHSSYQLQIV
jgi:Dynein light intermediate chain (DLIC)